MNRYVMFDIDDTLIYTSQQAYKKHIWICQYLKKDPTNYEDYFELFGKYSFDEMIQLLLPNISPQIYAKLYESAKLIYPYLNISNNIKTQIQGLKTKHYHIGILTNGPAKKTIEKLNYLGIYDDCEIILHADNMNYKKPDPRVFEHLFQHIQTDSSSIIYVGDALVDFYATKDTPITFYAVLTGFTTKQDFLDAGLPETFILENINDLFPKLI